MNQSRKCLSMVLTPTNYYYSYSFVQIKQYGYANCILLVLIYGLVFTEMYPLLKTYIGLLGWIVIFASTSLFSAVFGYFVLPETRGKSHEEIMKLL